MAFFIGLYSKKKIPFDQYADIKDLGQPIQFWGNLDSKKGRRAYPRLKEYSTPQSQTSDPMLLRQ